MKKSYCTQNHGDCSICSLLSYGLDCGNNPVSQMPPKSTKRSRAIASYDGFKGDSTVAHVLQLVGNELANRLTGHELGLVMSAVNRAYHAGKASTGADMIDDNAVWINKLNRAIEWVEVGSQYETVEEPIIVNGYRCGISHRPVKVKDGELVVRFAPQGGRYENIN
jgi:hypothetical protein